MNFDIFKKYKIQGFYYISKNGNPSAEMTDQIKWLENVYIKGFFEKSRDKKAFEYYKEKYPHLKGFIKIF